MHKEGSKNNGWFSIMARIWRSTCIIGAKKKAIATGSGPHASQQSVRARDREEKSVVGTSAWESGIAMSSRISPFILHAFSSIRSEE
eukprot:PDM60487.1 hypothetical protein PRIPAC_53465 [Pristionchus pacificus]